MVGKEDQQTISVTLPASTLRLLEEVAREGDSSVNEQAVGMIRVSMPMLHPPKTDDQWMEEVKEAQQDFSLLQRQFFHELRQNRRDEGEAAEPSATPSLEGEVHREGEQVLAITLSGYRMQRLQEISDERGTSVPEEAARLIQYTIDERYGPMTKEERVQQVKEAFQETDGMWKDIINYFRRGK